MTNRYALWVDAIRWLIAAALLLTATPHTFQAQPQQPTTATSALGGTYAVYGPEVFQRSTGQPVTVRRTISLSTAASDFLLRIRNGGTGSPVSSAVIAINGAVVFGPSDFNSNVTVLERQISLAITNELAVELRGQPGGRLTIEILSVDTEPPTIAAVASPNAGPMIWNNSPVTVTFTCTDAKSGIALCPPPLTVSAEGANQTISGTAIDRAGNQTTAEIKANLDLTAPNLSVASPPDGSSLQTPQVQLAGVVSDSLSGVTALNCNGVPGAIAAIGFTCNAVLSEGPNTIAIQAVDRAGNTSSLQWRLTLVTTPPDPGSGEIPPDPSEVAPPLKASGVTLLSEATQFLYEGANPIQHGVKPGTITPQRAAVIRGKVSTSGGTPLSGVSVHVIAHPEFGTTMTRSDGLFDMAVNGGGVITVEYRKEGFLPAQRQVTAPWQEFAWVPDTVLISLDSTVTPVTLAPSGAAQVARGSRIQDPDGARQATLVIPETGTRANLELADGTILRSLGQLNIRATEYTVGANGASAMPGQLPPTSGYTYAVELSADEAVDDWTNRITFDPPIAFYLENFLSIPVGLGVPAGYYDRSKASWIAANDGRVIGILNIADGVAVLDVNGAGTAATSEELGALGVTTGELRQLSNLYSTGQTLWRVPIAHFTPWDFNYPFGPGEDDRPPDLPPLEETVVKTRPLDDPCIKKRSIIECENQTLGESLRILGTGLTLNYRSDRMPGRKTGNSIAIPLTSFNVPATLQRIDIEVSVAGQRKQQSFPAGANRSYEFTWDGLDAYGRQVTGAQRLVARIGYVYSGVYQAPAQLAQSFGRFSGVPLTGNRTRNEIVLWQEQTAILHGPLDARAQGVGGWTLSNVHFYDPLSSTLYMGDGRRRSSDLNVVVAGIVAGTTEGESGDGGPATEAQLASTSNIAVAPDGSIYIAMGLRLRRIGPDGVIRLVAGSGTSSPPSSDGVLAINARLGVNDVAVSPQGRVFISDSQNAKVWELRPDGTIVTFAGNDGSGNAYQDGQPAKGAALFPFSITVGGDETVYISDLMDETSTFFLGRIRAVGLDGVIRTIARSTIEQPDLPINPIIGSDGSIYYIGGFTNRVWQLTSAGALRAIAGTGVSGFGGDGGRAVDAQLDGPQDLAISSDGFLYIVDAGNNRIRGVSPDGVIRTVAGNGEGAPTSGGTAAGNATFDWIESVAVAQDRSVLVGAGYQIVRLGKDLGGIRHGELLIPSEDATEVFAFAADGTHVQTINALTNSVKSAFEYVDGLLSTITDGDGNVTRVEYDSERRAIAVMAPFGQRTRFTTDANGYLASIADATGTTTFTYSSEGLLTSLTKPNNAAYFFDYDAVGRLIRDADPEGGSQSLSRIEVASGYAVTNMTALGRTTTYEGGTLVSGGSARLVTQPDGTSTETLILSDATTTTNGFDATRTTVRLSPDPRFGMKSPTEQVQLSLPSGLTRTVSTTRTSSLLHPENPLTLQQLTETTSVNGAQYLQTFNASTGTLTRTTPTGRSSQILFDGQGRIRSEHVFGIQPIESTYDAQGRVVTVSQGPRMFQMSYDDQGHLKTLTDPMSRVVTFERDAAGRVLTALLPGNRRVDYQYDANGNVISIAPPGTSPHQFQFNAIDLPIGYRGPVSGGLDQLTYLYNADRQLVREARLGGDNIDVTYDTGGRANLVTMPSATISYTYNQETGRPLTATTSDGVALTYQYDGPLLTETMWSGPISGRVRRTYNDEFLPSSIAVNGVAVEYRYDPDGFLIQAGALQLTRKPENGLLIRSVLGSVVESYSYNSFAEVSSTQATSATGMILRAEYERDILGRIIRKSETLGSVTYVFAYNYDEAGRLSEVRKNGTLISRYTYDSNGNRLTHSDGSGVVSGTYDAQDRVITYGQLAYSHTASGALQSKRNVTSGQLTLYSYDPLGNLRTVVLPSGDRIDYVIDGQSRRIGKRFNGTLVQGFLYEGDGRRLIAELDGSGFLVSSFVYGPKSNVPDYMIRGGALYRIVSDELGSPRVVVNAATGVIVQQLDYDPFGSVLVDSNPGFQPFGFAAGLYEMSTSLVRLGVRDYEPHVGRWTSKDPWLFGGGSTNLYTYVDNDPLNYVDLTGESKRRPSRPPRPAKPPPDPANPFDPISRPHDPVGNCGALCDVVFDSYLYMDQKQRAAVAFQGPKARPLGAMCRGDDPCSFGQPCLKSATPSPPDQVPMLDIWRLRSEGSNPSRDPNLRFLFP